jgi:hypothetical protein
MKYWFDTEFIEDGKTIELLSIGIVAEDGREFYAENQDADLSKASPWVKENVIPYLACRQRDKSAMNAWSRDGGVGGLMRHGSIGREIESFCSIELYGVPEFWADYCSYDWVVLCQTFGTMMDLPRGYPMYCHDLRHEIDRLRIAVADLPQQKSGNHNALEDARHCKALWTFLSTLQA